jgi:hypothetical protein
MSRRRGTLGARMTIVGPEKWVDREDFWLAAWLNVLFFRWKKRPTLESALLAVPAFVRQQQANPSGFVVCGGIEPESRLPDEAVRSAMLATFNTQGLKILAVAVVVDGDNLASAGKRAVLSGMSLVMRDRYPRTFPATIEEAAADVRAFVRDAPPAERIVAAYRSLL